MKYDHRIRQKVEEIVKKWYDDPELGYPSYMTLENCIQGAHGEVAAMMLEFGIDGIKKWKKIALQKRKKLGKNPCVRDDFDFETKDGKRVDAKSIQHFHKKLIVEKTNHQERQYDEYWVVHWNAAGDDFSIIKISCDKFDVHAKQVGKKLEMVIL